MEDRLFHIKRVFTFCTSPRVSRRTMSHSKRENSSGFEHFALPQNPPLLNHRSKDTRMWVKYKLIEIQNHD